MTRLLQRVLFWWMFSVEQRGIFAEAVEIVKNDPGIPIYGKDQYRHGREARRDRATELLQILLPELSDRQIHLGLELTVALTA